MALGDFLKKAADKGLELMGEAAEKGKKIVEESKEAVEKRRIIEERKKQRAGAKCPECEYGECYHLSGAFFCFCDDAQKCEIKQDCEDFTYQLFHEDALAILRKVALAEEIKFRAVTTEDFAKSDRLYEEAAKEYMQQFLPNFKDYEYGMDRIIDDVLTGTGLAGKGLVTLYEKMKNFNLNDFEELEEKFYVLFNYGIGASCGRHIGVINGEQDFLANYSLFNRSVIDFEFSLNVLALLDNSYELKKYYNNVSKIKKEDLYKENGDLKPVGRSEDGKDTLLGVIKTWEDNGNGENKLLTLYTQMVNHELPTVYEIKKECFNEVFCK